LKLLAEQFQQRAELTHQSADILGDAASLADEVGKEILGSAHCYLYAALICDFVKAAES